MIQFPTQSPAGGSLGVRAAGFPLATTSDFALALADLAREPDGIAPPVDPAPMALAQPLDRLEIAAPGKRLPRADAMSPQPDTAATVVTVGPILPCVMEPTPVLPVAVEWSSETPVAATVPTVPDVPADGAEPFTPTVVRSTPPPPSSTDLPSIAPAVRALTVPAPPPPGVSPAVNRPVDPSVTLSTPISTAADRALPVFQPTRPRATSAQAASAAASAQVRPRTRQVPVDIPPPSGDAPIDARALPPPDDVPGLAVGTQPGDAIARVVPPLPAAVAIATDAAPPVAATPATRPSVAVPRSTPQPPAVEGVAPIPPIVPTVVQSAVSPATPLLAPSVTSSPAPSTVAEAPARSAARTTSSQRPVTPTIDGSQVIALSPSDTPLFVEAPDAAAIDDGEGPPTHVSASALLPAEPPVAVSTAAPLVIATPVVAAIGVRPDANSPAILRTVQTAADPRAVAARFDTPPPMPATTDARPTAPIIGAVTSRSPDTSTPRSAPIRAAPQPVASDKAAPAATIEASAPSRRRAVADQPAPSFAAQPQETLPGLTVAASTWDRGIIEHVTAEMAPATLAAVTAVPPVAAAPALVPDPTVSSSGTPATIVARGAVGVDAVIAPRSLPAAAPVALQPVTKPSDLSVASPADPAVPVAAVGASSLDIVPTPAQRDPASVRDFETPARVKVTVVALPTAAPAPSSAQPAALAFAAAMFAAEPFTARPKREANDPAPLVLSPLHAATPQQPTLAVPAAAGGQQPTLDLKHDDWMASMIDRIETLRDESGQPRETRMRLAPEALGNVEVRVHRDEGGAIHVRIAADTPQARAILADAAPKLAEMAEARGVKLGGSSIDSHSGSAQHDRRDTPAPAPAWHRPASVAADADDLITDSRLA